MSSEISDIELEPGRRAFLATAIYGIGTAIGTALAVPVLVYLFWPSSRRKQSAWLDVGNESDLEQDKPKELTFRHNRLDGWKIYSERSTAWAVKSSDGSIIVFSPWCTHLGCAYHWEPSKHEFICPCHDSRFSIDGRVIQGPAPRPLDRFEVKVEGKRIWLHSLPQSRQAKA